MSAVRDIRSASRHAAAGMLSAAAVLGGCAGPFNEAVAPTGTEPLAALTAARPTVLWAEPSVDGLDRRSWTRVVIEVPAHQVSHSPAWTGLDGWRPRGDPPPPQWPTPDAALAGRPDAWADAADAVAAPVAAILDLPAAPVRMLLVQPPWAATRSPAEPYRRVPPATGAAPWDWVAPER